MAEFIACGDAAEKLRELPEGCVNTCVTSPPYYGLRDYGVPNQIGLEKTPDEYIEKLTAVFREVRRVLRPDGTLWVNIGDSYTSGGRAYRTADEKLPVRTMDVRPRTPDGMKAKDLIGIPWMLAFALRADGWYLRQDIIWYKPNCMPESVRDRCTKSHEYIFLLTKFPKYYFDAEAISEPIAETSIKRYQQDIEKQKGSTRQPGKTNGTMKAVLPRMYGKTYGDGEADEVKAKDRKQYVSDLRRNKRDVWTIATGGFKGAHFAVFPENLVTPCILAGCPEGGTVLDPFTGSGTTGVVAKRLRRNFVGIDINEDYVGLARERIERTQAECEQIALPL